MTNPIVIDVSHWQNTVDFKKVKAGGTVGVILKATEGTAYTDPTYASRRHQALDAGLCVATYHYLKKGSIAQQMNYYVKQVRPVVGERLVIDYEDSGLTIADLELAIKTLWDIVPQCEVTVYGANGFLGAQLAGKKNDILAKCSLWVASYTTADKPTVTNLKGTWSVWSLWQYAQDGKVDGVSGNCDVNRWNGSPESLTGWFYRENTPAPQPEPTPEPSSMVTIEVTAPEGVEVKVVVNRHQMG